MSERRFTTYEELDDASIVRIMLNRPDRRNAQNRGLLVELGEALLQAEADDRVRAVILGGVGPVFSSGHDLGSPESREETAPGPGQHASRTIHGGTKAGAEGRMLQEWHYFFQNTLRWRNLRKITIAQVQGPVIAAGLMLAWCCDLIVAADDASFVDVVGVRLGMCGLEYFAHPWEFGPRKAKELLLTGGVLDARQAERLGMVTSVVPGGELADAALGLARSVAKLPSVTSLLIKESVNQTMDQMGFGNALNSAFSLHQVNHAHWAEVNDGLPVARLG
ncbi:MAG TPA: enoyl-CoA hydratase [Trebonia sp.]|nr:enoyl-CoA hydratase [Trebonia sp.]